MHMKFHINIVANKCLLPDKWLIEMIKLFGY